ncbi:hypothetical protein NDR89_20485 [Cupriavidus gilardii]|uniref:Uncharacterized protein n=1 Tax=Cupriavidus gilardii TaxID=82541 RepID=A0ABY4VRX3_9BURK|nr:hypothetical protein [Cupriavidus gilardii]USE79017.1 hypothetical protein NDR89_20485 [Cupriavidus gilardii]
MNYNRMTIRATGDKCEVHKLHPHHQYASGSPTGGGARQTRFVARPYARPLFVGTYGDCLAYIESQGAEFMTEHGISVPTATEIEVTPLHQCLPEAARPSASLVMEAWDRMEHERKRERLDRAAEVRRKARNSL